MPPKINLPGLKLRKKSSVHARVIDEQTGRRKVDAAICESTLKRLRSSYSEGWKYNGEIVAPPEEKALIKDLLKLRKQNNKIKKPIDTLILGPGDYGAEINFIKNKLFDMKNNVDSLGLTNSLTGNAREEVRNHYYSEKLERNDFFEHMNHLKLLNKYNYIYSSVGPGLHTLYPEIVLLKVASLLKVGGFARIDVLSHNKKNILTNIREYLINKDVIQDLELKVDGRWILIKRLK